MKQMRKELGILMLLCIIFIFAIPVMAQDSTVKKNIDIPSQNENHNIVNHSTMISNKESKTLSKLYHSASNNGMISLQYATDPYYLTEVLPEPYDELVQGERLYVKFYARDTWKHYFTKPIVCVFDSNDQIVYYSEQSVVSVSGQDTYSGYISWNTSNVMPGEYSLFIANAPCHADGTLLDNWSTFDTPCINTSFIIKAHNHRLVIDKGVSATCGRSGLTEGSHCSICGNVIKEQKVIPATGKHKFGNYVITKNPTLTVQGAKTRTCSTCGKKETITMPKITQNIPVQIGKSLMLSKIVTSGKIASATSANTKVATITNKEKVTGKAAGTSVIEVKLANGNFVYVQVTIQKNAVVTSKITGVPTSVKLNMGQSKKLAPVISPITSTDKVTYTSSNKKVATVSSSGVVTAKKSGTAKITVKAGRKKVTVTVTVAKKAPTGISGVPATKELKKGKSFAIKAKLTPSGAEGKIAYQSSNKSVATVDSKGKVKAKKAGTAVITVSVGNIKRTCKITVKK